MMRTGCEAAVNIGRIVRRASSRGAFLCLLGLLALVPPRRAAAQSAGNEEEVIKMTVDDVYLEAVWHEGDVMKALPGWYENCPVVDVRDGRLRISPLLDWFRTVHARGNPGDPTWSFRYPLVDVAGDVAIAKVELSQGDEHRYTDYFPVVRADNGWRISGYFAFGHRLGTGAPGPDDVERAKRVVEDSYIRGFMVDGDTTAAMRGVHPEALFLKHYPEFGRVATISAGLVLPRIASSGGWVPQGASEISLIDLTGTAGVARVDTRVDGRLVVTSYLMLHRPEGGWTISGVLAHLWQSGPA